MKHCPNPNCEHFALFGRACEFLDSVALCSECGTRLLDGEAPPARPVEYRELATVYETNDRIKAHLIRAVLVQEGIPALVGGESLQGAVGELPALMFIRVQVPIEHATRAREIALSSDADE